MSLNYNELLQEMLSAAMPVLKKQWREAKPEMEGRFARLLKNIKEIEVLKLRGEISEEQATLHIRVQIKSIKTVIQSVKGLTLLTLESAINAAIDVVRGRINGTIGWPLL